MRAGFFTKFATLAHGGAPDYGHQLRQKAFVLSRRVLRTYYVVSDPQINFAKPAENWWFVSKATSYVEVRLSFNSIYLCTYTLYVHMYLGTGYSFWDWLRNFLLKFTWIVFLVHKLKKLGKLWYIRGQLLNNKSSYGWYEKSLWRSHNY